MEELNTLDIITIQWWLKAVQNDSRQGNGEQLVGIVVLMLPMYMLYLAFDNWFFICAYFVHNS